ncbi:TniQ family protein [Mesorhizobium sp. M0159]|uniref:TniQ family protein n=1 Tax=Mesorhizobium sp. M0159 TaxID=2956900 RepID=UPI00333C00AB
MNSDAIGAGFAIEIRERYRDVVYNRWPVYVDPLPDELLSSWLQRLALAHGLGPSSFAGVLGLGDGMWSPRLDLLLEAGLAPSTRPN